MSIDALVFSPSCPSTINKKTYQAAKEEPITLSTMPMMYATNKAPYFCDYVMKDLHKLGFTEEEIVNGGLKVITTLNYQAQIKANEAILNNLNACVLAEAYGESSAARKLNA